MKEIGRWFVDNIVTNGSFWGTLIIILILFIFLLLVSKGAIGLWDRFFGKNTMPGGGHEVNDEHDRPKKG